MVVRPEFPLQIVFHEDGDLWVFDNEREAACSLEWFDSDDPDENATVTDRRGRRVRVKVEKLKLIRLELYA